MLTQSNLVITARLQIGQANKQRRIDDPALVIDMVFSARISRMNLAANIFHGVNETAQALLKEKSLNL